MCVRGTSQVDEGLNLRKLVNLKKIPEMLGFDDEYPADYPKAKF